MATLSSLRTDLRQLLDETDSSNSNYSDAELLGYLNKALRRLATQQRWGWTTSTATTVANQQTYSLPNDFIGIIEAKFDGTRITVIDEVDLSQQNPAWENDAAGTPSFIYKASNALIGLQPAPNTANANKTLEIIYVNLPAGLVADTDVPAIIDAFQDCLPWYAAALAHYRVGNLIQAKEMRASFMENVRGVQTQVDNFASDMKRFRWMVDV